MTKTNKEDFLSYADKSNHFLEMVKRSCTKSNIPFVPFQKIIDDYKIPLNSIMKVGSRPKNGCNQNEPFVEPYSTAEFIRKNEICGIIATKIFLKIQSENSHLKELLNQIDCYIIELVDTLNKKSLLFDVRRKYSRALFVHQSHQ